MTDLASHAETIARALLGTPNAALSTAAQWRYGTNGSLAIEVAGEKAGAWYDHEHQTGGGLLDLIVRERGCDRAGALTWLKSDLGIDVAGGNGAAGKPQQRRRVAVYVYRDARGEPLFAVSRWDPKDFTQHPYDPATGTFATGKGAMKGIKPVPYRLPELLASDGRVWVCEGEKDCDRLAGLGLVATTNPGGVGKWPPDFAKHFAGRDVVISPHNDKAGRDHARDVAANLRPVAAAVRILELPALLPKQDVSDWLDHGNTVAQLERLLQQGGPVGPDRDASSGAKSARLAVDGAALLNAVQTFLCRFISYPSPEAAVAHVLWIAHAHLMDAWESTPRIAFLSPEPASGKTRALEVSELLVPRPVEAVNVSPPYLFRKVASDDGAPTILFDEIDTVFGPRARDNEEIRGLLNAGHRRGAVAGRCVVRGKIVETEEIPAYCAVALAGLGWLPDTLMTRAVVIRMRPRTPTERVEPYRRRLHCADGLALRQRLEVWAESALDAIMGTWPELPAGVQDRAADVWEPLVAVADAAGAAWPGRARAAAVALVGEAMENTPSLGVRLLADLRTIFGQHAAMRTTDILNALHALEEAPWSDPGKPLNARGLATRLRQYRVARKKLRSGDQTMWGYVRSDLADPWSRYLPPESGTSGTSGTDGPEPNGAASSDVPDDVPDSGRVPDDVPDSVPPKVAETADVPDVPDSVAAHGRERCSICSGIIVPGDRAVEGDRPLHPTCLAGLRSWPESAQRQFWRSLA
jgi:Protein of unknown function (DUF3631)